MSLYPGQKVRVSANGGYDYQRARAAELMGNRVCTVEKTIMGKFHTDVFLKEFPGEPFNSCVLEEADDDSDIHTSNKS